jgi:hypothetical protein
MAKLNKPKQSDGRSECRVLSVLKSRPVLVIRLILEVLGVIMTALFFWPKFSVAPSSAWDSSNPIQSTFTIKNDSNIGCYKVTSNFGSNITIHGNAVLGAPISLIPKLCPSESSTISIEKIITTSANAIDEAEVYINLTYRPTIIPIKFSAKSYRFKARKTPSGYIWEPMYMDRIVN